MECVWLRCRKTAEGASQCSMSIMNVETINWVSQCRIQVRTILVTAVTTAALLNDNVSPFI